MNNFDKLTEIEHRVACLKDNTQVSLLGVTPAELQDSINDANMIRKLGYQLENHLKGLHLKLFDETWDPDVIAHPPKGDESVPVKLTAADIAAGVKELMENDPTCQYIRGNSKRVRDAFKDTIADAEETRRSRLPPKDDVDVFMAELADEEAHDDTPL